jgi:general stress protein 26
MQNLKKPAANLPYPLAHYGFPESEEVLLPWSHVSERVNMARNYWVCTVTAKGDPHARPVWGVWVDDTLFFGGGPHTRWFRNVKANPRLTVHLEDGNEAIIFEGQASPVNDEALMTRIDDAYEVKYNMRHGPPIWQINPDRVFAWRSMDTVTKFTFD